MDSIEGEAWIEGIRNGLATWYEREHRDLPWRRDRDPYRILVSEMMLVQTTVAAVVPYFERFIARFPDVQALSAAGEDEVLKLWEGLGYYRRARQLHQAARQVVEKHAGRFPDDEAALRALPGVGRYIAGALLSFAFDRPAAILEANTQRVLARWLAWREPIQTSRSQARLWQVAERLVPPHDSGRFNQAFMELGATICTPRTPSCLICPVAILCQSRALGLQDDLPVKQAKASALEVSEACVLVVQDDRLLMVRRRPEGLWAGFWEFPTVSVSGADPAGRAWAAPVSLGEGVLRLTGIVAKVGPVLKEIRYVVTRHKVTLSAHVGKPLGGELFAGPKISEARWVAWDEIDTLTLSSPMRRLVRWAMQEGIVEPNP